jgi:hypothetical protein
MLGKHEGVPYALNHLNYATQILDNTRFNFLLMEMHENPEIPAQFRPVVIPSRAHVPFSAFFRGKTC